MRFYQQTADWLETRWVNPAYSGWLTLGLALFFFASATNTMAGWLYVISGVMFALLAIAIVLPSRSLRGLHLTRRPIQPVSAGDRLLLELSLENQTPYPKTLVQVQDLLPYGLGKVLGKPLEQAIEIIPAHETYHWVTEYPTERRGIYRWHTVQLRTAAPLGLFWCRRHHTVNARAIVYPTVLPLSQCPLIDQLGQDPQQQVQSNYQARAATEGLTQTLRPYRWGDPTRLIHWRSSARHGELRVREMEVYTGGQELIICLDSAFNWELEDFEQAVTAAASLYFYAFNRQLPVSLWTAATGLVKGDRAVLETLAATQSGEAFQTDAVPEQPLLWISQNADSLQSLPAGSRWVLWASAAGIAPGRKASITPLPGLLIQPEQRLQLQLQAAING